jgi:hypothetical protein
LASDVGATKRPRPSFRTAAKGPYGTPSACPTRSASPSRSTSATTQRNPPESASGHDPGGSKRTAAALKNARRSPLPRAATRSRSASPSKSATSVPGAATRSSPKAVEPPAPAAETSENSQPIEDERPYSSVPSPSRSSARYATAAYGRAVATGLP